MRVLRIVLGIALLASASCTRERTVAPGANLILVSLDDLRRDRLHLSRS